MECNPQQKKVQGYTSKKKVIHLASIKEMSLGDYEKIGDKIVKEKGGGSQPRSQIWIIEL